MDGIKIEVTGNIARVIKRPARITAGTVGLPVEFAFDSQWDGLSKTAVFRAGHVSKIADNIVEATTVPWEVLKKGNIWLSIGVYGVNADGSIAIPTIWANVCVIQIGVSPDGDPSTQPEHPAWQKALNSIGNLDELKTENKSNLVGAVNEVRDISKTVGDALKDKAASHHLHSVLDIYDFPVPDKTLTKDGFAADAKATGEKIGAAASALSEEIAVERARIDNLSRLPEGGTTGDAELHDIRVGYDGKTYDNAGEAVRGQASTLNSELVALNPPKDFTWTVGKTVNSVGEEANSNYAARTGYTACEEGDILKFVGQKKDDNGVAFTYYVHLYDGAKNWIRREYTSIVVIDANTKFYRVVFGRATSGGLHMTEEGLRYFALRHLTATPEKRNVPSVVFDPIQNIAEKTDFDSLIIPGKYNVVSSDIMSTLLNAPPTQSAGTLYVIQTYRTDRLVHIYINVHAKIWTRSKIDTWETWQSNNHSLGTTTSEGLKSVSCRSKCATGFTALKNVGTLFDAGKTYSGVPYYSSGTHQNGRDAYNHFSLDAVFSMFNNPDSLMYTYPANNDGKLYTGGVCSSFVSFICGLPVFCTTNDIRKMLNYKTIYDLADIEIGDVLICHTYDGDASNHAAVVTDIYANNDGVVSIDISEAWSPVFRTVNMTAKAFWGLLNGTTREGCFYKVGRFDNHKIRSIPPVVVNTDIISERGDNTFFEKGENIFIQSFQGAFNVVSPSGVTKEVDFTALDAKDGTSMRNIGAILNEIGKWTLCGSNGEESHLTIIQKGEAVLNNGVVTLSGYQGCKPSGFIAVGVMEGTSSGGYEPYRDGCYASRLVVYSKDDPRYIGEIKADTFSVNFDDVDRDKYVAVYVRVFYDTGCGQAYLDTNLQDLK